LRAVKLGWKNYYKHTPLIYSDPELLIPIPKTFIRSHTFTGFRHEFLSLLRLALNETTKYAVTKILVEQVNTRVRLRGRSFHGKRVVKSAGRLYGGWIEGSYYG